MANVLALVTFKIYPAEMGGQKSVALFYEHLSQHHNIIVAASQDNPASPDVYPMLFPNRKIYRNLSLVSELASLVKKKNIEILIAEHSYPGWIARLVAKRCGIPFIIHSHNIESLRFRSLDRAWWKAYWHYEKWIHRKADHSFFITEPDKELAVKEFGVPPGKCTVITYGVEEYRVASEKKTITEPVLLFNGSLDYKPNADALNDLLFKINPLLREKLSHYRIVIAGKGATEEQQKKIKEVREAEFVGYVNDLRSLLQNATLFLNPVLNDTGIKTKVVEAIGNHCTVISTLSGASGIEKEVCGNKLVVTPDNDWQFFSNEIVRAVQEEQEPTPADFFRHYSWEVIAAKAAYAITGTLSNYNGYHINS